MSEATLPLNSLVLYKNQPARLSKAGDKKIEIELADGRSLKVRPKDVDLLHPGPIHSASGLPSPAGDVATAWELLQGSVNTLPELAELAFTDYTPATAWAVWQLLADGLYFSGTIEAVVVHTPAEVAAAQAARAAKAAEEQAWQAFLTRLEKGEVGEEDGRYLQEIAALALGQTQRSQALRALNQAETPEVAHALLLKTGYWDASQNPYPARAGLPTTSPELPVSALPEEERRDLTHLVALAIDDEGSTDPDDAVSWENGRLWVHIADVAALVPPDSLLDLEARARGANLYLPEGTITMLPPAATQWLGLGLAELSPALSFGLDLGEDGEVTQLEIVPSWIHVTRLTYEEAETRLDEAPFQSLYEIAKRAEARRQENGAVHIDLPEVRVRVDEAGMVSIRPLPNLRSRDLVREAMLLAGEAVARFAFQNNIPLPYTTQEAPSEPLPPAHTLSDFFARRRLMKPSQPSSMPGAHAGLGLGLYAQATSPLRRYLDLVVHQQLRAYIAGETLLDEQEVMARVGAAEAVSGDVRRTERLSNRHWTLVYLEQHPDWRGQGVIVEKRGRKDVVLIPELDLEARVYVKGERPLDSTILLQLTEIDLVNLEARFREAA
ncbi:MAG: RNB domain-containing ribonuclease [Ardenticatenaceae bacterium]|nr:RNB domain-containing ribonuclease [Ardenticatenaceae bacterium]